MTPIHKIHPVNSTTCLECKAIGTHTATCSHQCPIGTPWCSDHTNEFGDEQCVSVPVDAWDPRPGERVLRDRQVSVWLTQRIGMGEPVVAVDTAAGAEITLAAAVSLQSALSSLLRMAEQ